MTTPVGFAISPRGPFDLANQNRYFGAWPVVQGALAMTFPVEGRRDSVAVLLRQDADRVTGEVHGVTGADAELAWNQALAAVSLDVDGRGYTGVGQRDPAIGRLQEQFGHLRPSLFHSPYEGACAFVIGHRLSIAQGRRTRARLAQEFGDTLVVAGTELHAFPGPARLLELDQLPGVGAPKVEKLHAIARAALDGRLDRAALRALPEEEALRQLQTLPGIGPFFAQGILYRAAGLADALPDDDLTVRAVRAACDLPGSAGWAEVRGRAERWRPFRMWCVVQLHVWYRSLPGVAVGLRGAGARARP